MFRHDVNLSDCSITYYRDGQVYMVIDFICIQDLIRYMKDFS